MQSRLERELRAITRNTTWIQRNAVPLEGNVHHPQGLARVDVTWWLSTIDMQTKRGLLISFNSAGKRQSEIVIGDVIMCHPSGMAFDGDHIWVACSTYEPLGPSRVYRFDPLTRRVMAVFEVDDHIGAIARLSPYELFGWSWGSRTLYRWSLEGQQISKTLNPSHFVDWQDLQPLGQTLVACTGVGTVELESGQSVNIGGVALVDAGSMSVLHEAPVAAFSRAGRVITTNPMALYYEDGALCLWTSPDDEEGELICCVPAQPTLMRC